MSCDLGREQTVLRRGWSPCCRGVFLETRLSDQLGEQIWRARGLGAPTDIDQLHTRIVTLEQQVIDLRLQLEERDQDLAAARAANRELMTKLNASRQTGWHAARSHYTCCAPYSSTISHTTSGNAGCRQSLQAGAPSEKEAFRPWIPTPVEFEQRLIVSSTLSVAA